MKLSIIPAPYELEYLQGFTKTTAPVTEYEENGLPEDGFVLHINGDIRIGGHGKAGQQHSGQHRECQNLDCLSCKMKHR